MLPVKIALLAGEQAQDLVLEDFELAELAEELRGDLELGKLAAREPEPAFNPRGRGALRSAFALETTVVLMIGISLGSIAKPFTDAILEEAGKDSWQALKRLVSRIWTRQAEQAYRLRSDAYLVFSHRDAYIALRVGSRPTARREGRAKFEDGEGERVTPDGFLPVFEEQNRGLLAAPITGLWTLAEAYAREEKLEKGRVYVFGEVSGTPTLLTTYRSLDDLLARRS